MKTFYGYQLTLAFYKNGEPIKDYSSGAGVDLVDSFSNYVDTNLAYKKKDISERVQFGTMNLSSLSYQKQMYKPNCIKASIECSSDLKSSMLLLADFFKEAKAKLAVVGYSEVEDQSGNKSISVDKDVASKLIADKYEVYEASPRYDKSQGKMYIDLVMYSPDKVLDTFEYSKAYTNKRLGLDIFKTEAAAISPTLKTNCAYMQVLRLANGEEFLQPYLVQYNESFYSFLSRVANRCGEFLYYDDVQGILNLGIRPNKTKEVVKGGKKVKENEYDFTDSDFDKISFTDFNTLHNREADSEDFYSNYMIKKFQNPTRSFVRNSELSGNEYFETVEKGNFSSSEEEHQYEAYSLYHTLAKLFTNTMGAGLFLAGVNIVKEDKFDLSGKAKAVNKHFDNKFFSGISESKRLLFGSADSMISIDKNVVNVNSAFYPMVRDKELACNRGRVSFQISSNISKNVMLGDRIDFFGKEYIVIEVAASFDVVVNSNGSTAIRQPINVVAIPVNGTPIPASSVEPIRKVGCQKAFVTDVDDPSFLGRVRVRFSWQGLAADSSPWIRVCTQMANSNGGTAFFKAAVGDSVLIEFENGNVDMPYVSGFLPMMSQQKNKGQYLSRRNSVVVSSEHGQMMLMSDPTDGNNLMGLEALPSMIAPFGLCFPGSFPSYKEAKPRFLGSTEFTDYYGTYSVKMSSTDRSVSINSPFGKVEVNAFTGITINAPQGDINITGKNVSISALNNISIESGLNAKTGSFRYTMDLILGAGADFVAETLAPMVLDLSYIRNILEIFIHPCEGTLSLKGGRYLMMQAGGAAAKIPFTGFVIPKAGTVNFDPEKDKIAALLTALNFSDGAVRTIAYNLSEINKMKDEVLETWNKKIFFTNDDGERIPRIKPECCSLQMLVDRANVPSDQQPDLFENFEVTEEYMERRKNKYIAEITRAGCVGPAGAAYFGALDSIEIPDPLPACVSCQEKLASVANGLVNKLRNVLLSSGFKLKFEDNRICIDNSDEKVPGIVDILVGDMDLGGYKDLIVNELKEILKGDNINDFSLRANKRKLAVKILKHAYTDENINGLKNPGDFDDYSNDKAWKNFVKAMFAEMNVGAFGHIKASAMNAGKMLFDKLYPLQQYSGKWAQGWRSWKTERRGQILMSDTEGKTMYFNNGTLKSFSNSDLYSVKTYCENYL